MFEWDENKNRRNHEKHGISFEDAREAFYDLVLRKADNRKDYGELRYQALGNLRGNVVFMVYTLRNEKIRLISVREASTTETRIYHDGIRNGLGQTGFPNR